MDVVALAQHGFGNAVATLGTACTTQHVQKLFRFTDTVVFSFDGDAAGRRAAGRALEAALPHATDLRNVRFLFLPPEHDTTASCATAARTPSASWWPSGAAVAAADRHASRGRTGMPRPGRMLAQAKPLWMGLPEGALRRQLLPELARHALMEPADLAALWGQAAATRPAPAAPRLPLRAASRRTPAGLADQALRLLLRHNEWWEQLSGEDHGLLHELGGTHGEVLAWLERQIVEHGPQTWAALAAAMAEEAWAGTARGWVHSEVADLEHGFEDLQRVMRRLWIDALGHDADRLAQGAPDAEALAQLGRLRERIASLKAALSGAAGQPA